MATVSQLLMLPNSSADLVALELASVKPLVNVNPTSTNPVVAIEVDDYNKRLNIIRAKIATVVRTMPKEPETRKSVPVVHKSVPVVHKSVPVVHKAVPIANKPKTAMLVPKPAQKPALGGAWGVFGDVIKVSDDELKARNKENANDAQSYRPEIRETYVKNGESEKMVHAKIEKACESKVTGKKLSINIKVANEKGGCGAKSSALLSSARMLATELDAWNTWAQNK